MFSGPSRVLRLTYLPSLRPPGSASRVGTEVRGPSRVLRVTYPRSVPPGNISRVGTEVLAPRAETLADPVSLVAGETVSTFPKPSRVSGGCPSLGV